MGGVDLVEDSLDPATCEGAAPIGLESQASLNLTARQATPAAAERSFTPSVA